MHILKSRYNFEYVNADVKTALNGSHEVKLCSVSWVQPS